MFRVGQHWLSAICAMLALAAPAKADLLPDASGHPCAANPGITFEQQLGHLKDLRLKSNRGDASRLSWAPAPRQLLGPLKRREGEIPCVLVPVLSLAKTSGGGTNSWMPKYERGRSFADILRAILQSEEFDDAWSTSSISDSEFVTLALERLLGRDPSGDDLKRQLARLEAGSVTRFDPTSAVVGSDEARSHHAMISSLLRPP